jgi:hypothetical protein
MIAFQHIKSGEFLRSRSEWSHAALLADAYPFHSSDEAPMRRDWPALAAYRTVTFSTRIDHPLNNLASLTREQLAERYPIAR